MGIAVAVEGLIANDLLRVPASLPNQLLNRLCRIPGGDVGVAAGLDADAKDCCHFGIGSEDAELLPTTRRPVDQRLTYGYRRIAAPLNRNAEA
ncbi:hypothetical protein [Pseudorhizobium endolithicum]|uniref:hypothetical protein n=1 Tax=Pseudorhizobium endolithicum TaxID=1191678 RepID=UPI0011584A65|nr:hypothetical protein [Pseudorhizobium endolithicum]